ncbi:MAG: AMP-binding protein, partial [bacterium]|nr:AMP-binding protein [bacterium]
PLRAVFEQPTVAGLAGCVDAALRREERSETPPLRPVARDAPLPLSFAQQRLWFLDRLEPGSAVYAIPTSLVLGGRLHRRALSRALNEIVRRHEVLRTRFATVDGEPFQVIAPEPELPLALVDLGGLGETPRRLEVRRLASAQARRPFDLARGPLLRATLLRRGDDQHTLLLAVHHIAFDGWSAGVFLNELSVLYRAFSAGEASPLPELAVQYADFAGWQRQWLRGEVLERQLGYWREQLAGLPVLELPTDRPRPAVQSFRGGSESLRLPAELHDRLRALSRERGTTMFMTFLAAFQVLLGRITGEANLAVGSPIAGRNRAEIEGLVGFFVNTLVLRGDLRGDPSFGELLARVREVALGAYAHQDVPFESLVEALDPERNLSQNPLVQVLFLFQNAPAGTADFGPELRVGIEGVATGEAKFDLTLGLVEGEGGLRGGLEYNVDLFDASTIHRLLRHFRALLENVAAFPDCGLSQLSLLAGVEQHQLLREWNDTPLRVAAVDGATLHGLFEAQAAATPEAMALVWGGRRLSYRELDRRANGLADDLRSLGVETEVTVGICAERTPALVIAILAVLKAGGTYVPLDPAYPRQRIAFMLEDAGVRVLLTQESLRATLPEHGAQVVCPMSSSSSSSSSSPASTPGNLAYVIYTSGSTGRPKGVAIEHRHAVAMVAWAHQEFPAA